MSGGGAERQVIEILRHLDRNRFEPFLYLASREGDLLDLAVDRKIVDKSGTWFAFNGDRLGQGRENVKQFLKDNPAVFKSLEEKVRRELGMGREAEVAV